MIMKYAHKQMTRSEPKYLNIYLWGSDLVKYHFSGTPPGGWNITLVICLCAYFINNKLKIIRYGIYNGMKQEGAEKAIACMLYFR